MSSWNALTSIGKEKGKGFMTYKHSPNPDFKTLSKPLLASESDFQPTLENLDKLMPFFLMEIQDLVDP
jgi:hypothetical protein